MRSQRARLGAAAAAILIVAVAVVLLATGGSGSGKRSGPTIVPEPPAPAGAPAKPAPTTELLGVNVNRLFNDRTFSLAEIDAQLAAVRLTGATVARTDALWEAAEPDAPADGIHHYDWGFDDLIAATLAEHDLRWLPILDYSAPWDQSIPGQDHSAPRLGSAFAQWAGAFAARYGPEGAFWRAHPAIKADPVETYEVWNEPDNSEFWLPSPDAALYAELYLRTRNAIDAAQPTARVIIGGLTNPGQFLPAMVRARPDLAGHIDGVAIHPYGANPFVVIDRVRGARATLDALGLSHVPLYVTEFGWTTSPPGALSWAPAQSRPGYIASTLASLGHTDCGIAAALLYTWITPERDPANHEDWFGIEPPGGGPSSDVTAFATGLQKASAPAPLERVCRSR